MEWEGRAPSRPNTPSHPYSGRIVDASLPFIMPYHKSSNHKSSNPPMTIEWLMGRRKPGGLRRTKMPLARKATGGTEASGRARDRHGTADAAGTATGSAGRNDQAPRPVAADG